MDQRTSKHGTGVAIKSTRGLLLSQPYESHYPNSSTSSTSSKINATKREASSGPKLIEIVKQKLNHGAKMIQLGSLGKIFRKTFSITEEEKLLQAFQCYLYTTAGAIAGILFVSTERVAFCSDRSIKTYSSTGELLKFQYKVSIPLGKIKGVRESMNMRRPSYNYVELVTVDDFSFWFLGFEKMGRVLATVGFYCDVERMKYRVGEKGEMSVFSSSSGPKLIEMVKQKLNHGAKMIQLDSLGKIFKKTFSIREEEKLLQASQCYLYTTEGEIAGILFVSTERVAFCSDRPMKTYSTTGKLLKFHYKVSIPLGKIQGVRESMNMKRQSYNYVELVTIDDFSFWFLGFVNYEKALRYLHHAIGLSA
ncbi:hypothetical protein LXL04_025614 [Taraxacum kok-saghyz]